MGLRIIRASNEQQQKGFAARCEWCGHLTASYPTEAEALTSWGHHSCVPSPRVAEENRFREPARSGS